MLHSKQMEYRMTDEEIRLLKTLPIAWQAHILEAEIKRMDQSLTQWRARVKQQEAAGEEVICWHPRYLGQIDDLQQMLQQLQT